MHQTSPAHLRRCQACQRKQEAARSFPSRVQTPSRQQRRPKTPARASTVSIATTSVEAPKSRAVETTVHQVKPLTPPHSPLPSPPRTPSPSTPHTPMQASIDLTEVRARIRAFEETAAFAAYLRDKEIIQRKVKLVAVRNLKERLTYFESFEIEAARRTVEEFEQTVGKAYFADLALVAQQEEDN